MNKCQVRIANTVACYLTATLTHAAVIPPPGPFEILSTGNVEYSVPVSEGGIQSTSATLYLQNVAEQSLIPDSAVVNVSLATTITGTYTNNSIVFSGDLIAPVRTTNSFNAFLPNTAAITFNRTIPLDCVTSICFPFSIPYTYVELVRQRSSFSYAFPNSFVATNHIDVASTARLLGGSGSFSGSINYAANASVIYQYPKSPDYIAYHQQLVNNANTGLASLGLFSAISSFSGPATIGAIIQAVVNTLSISSNSNDAPQWANPISAVLVLLATAAFGSGPLALASLVISSAYSLLYAYYYAVSAIETKIVHDPPDANYAEVYAYSGLKLNLDLGNGSNANSFLATGFYDLTHLLEAEQGELTSLERAEGALAAGDVAAYMAQVEAEQAFALDTVNLSDTAGNWLATLPSFLTSNGFDTGVPNVDLFYQAVNDTAAQLTSTGNVPEPSVVLLLGAGFTALGMAVGSKRLWTLSPRKFPN